MRYLLHLEGIPAVDVTVEADHSYLLGPMIIAEGPHSVSLLALLVHEWPDVLVACVRQGPGDLTKAAGDV